MLKKAIFLLLIILGSCNMNKTKMKLVALVKLDQRYGYIDQEGTFLIPARYEWASDFQEGYALTGLEYPDRIIDIHGNSVVEIPDSFSFNNTIYKGKIRFFKSGSEQEKKKVKNGDVVHTWIEMEPAAYGIFNLNDKKYYTFNKFAWIDEQFNEELVAVQGSNSDSVTHERPQENGWGFADMQGNLVIDTVFEDVRNFSEGLAPVRSKGLWGYIGKDGKWAIPPGFEKAEPFSEGMAVIRKNGLYGLIDKSGSIKIPANYTYLGQVSEGLILVSTQGKEETINNYQTVYTGSNYGFLDTNGNKIIPAEYTYATSFSEGLALVVKNDQWGALDKHNQWVVPNQFQEIKPFSKGYAAAMKNGKWGYINTKGEWIISPKFEEANNFTEIQ